MIHLYDLETVLINAGDEICHEDRTQVYGMRSELKRHWEEIVTLLKNSIGFASNIEMFQGEVAVESIEEAFLLADDLSKLAASLLIGHRKFVKYVFEESKKYFMQSLDRTKSIACSKWLKC